MGVGVEKKGSSPCLEENHGIPPLASHLTELSCCSNVLEQKKNKL
jgi:hypothetical protein